ncbi:16330_t:CDS:1, partial [Racocetra persica]
EEEKTTNNLSVKRQELINLSEQAIIKEKEIMELRRQLFKIAYERINKQYEEK